MFARLREALVAIAATRARRATTCSARGPFAESTASGRSASRACRRSASTGRVPPRHDRPPVLLAIATPTSASRRATTRTTSSRSSARCTRAATASTSRVSPALAHAARARSRSACTSSQSRLWENLVGRSLRSGAGSTRARSDVPRAVDGVDAEEFYRAANRVEPSLIRVEADEVTYNLHIMVRFELERSCSTATLVDRRPARGVERALPRLPRARGARRRARLSAGRALVVRPVRLLPDLHARQRDRRADLGGGAAALPDLDAQIEQASSRRSAPGCARTSTRSAASSRRRRRSTRRRAARSTRSRTSPI